MLETLMMDVRYSARRLMRRRTYALMAVLTLALGAGGTAAIFSIARLALGLPPQRVMGQVVGRGVVLAVFGSVLGLVAVIASAQGLSTLLYGVQPSDAGALLVAVLLLLLTATVASVIPAWRASRTDPATVLRQQ